MCSNIMRDPAVFDAFGPSVANVARDIAIWVAVQHHPEATLPVRQFAKMFGYSDAFLFKRVSSDQAKELKRLGFGPEIKDVIGYTLAKMTVQQLIFSNGYQAVGIDGIEQVRTYQAIGLLRQLNVHTSRKGTYYSFKVSGTFLANCHKRFQKFDLATYTSLTTGRGNAYSAARKLYLHCVWKRRVWDVAKKEPGVKPSMSIFAELVKVAGLDYKDEARTAHELRELLELVATLPGVEMSATVEQLAGTYSVQFRRHTSAE
jgi:hypothetical protein